MSEQKRKELASRGGRKAQAAGTAHRWDTETARLAGHMGGLATQKRNKEDNQ